MKNNDYPEDFIFEMHPIVKELIQIGFNSDDIMELKKYNYKAAIPILLKWLPRVKNRELRHFIIRSLAVSWAKPIAAKPLIEEFKKEDPLDKKNRLWEIGNSLEVVVDDSVYDDIVKLVTDKRYGDGREMLAMAMGKMKNPKAVDVLIGLLDDNDVAGHAIIGLGRLKNEKALPHLNKFINHPKTWWRNEAKKAIAKIEKAKEKQAQKSMKKK